MRDLKTRKKCEDVLYGQSHTGSFIEWEFVKFSHKNLKCFCWFIFYYVNRLANFFDLLGKPELFPYFQNREGRASAPIETVIAAKVLITCRFTFWFMWNIKHHNHATFMNQKVVTENFIIEPTGDKYFSCCIKRLNKTLNFWNSGI